MAIRTLNTITMTDDEYNEYLESLDDRDDRDDTGLMDEYLEWL